MSSSSIYPERPIRQSTDDKLERSRFIERLTSTLVNPTTNRATGVVVGITGPWGSGKSSILNLLQEQIKNRYEDALIVRFDPWLVSGRNDLIAEFLGELIGTIKDDEKRLSKFKKFAATLADYGAQLAPIGNLWKPGIGTVLSGGLRSIKEALSKKESLEKLRQRLMNDLEEISAPIVVLIDEIDRVEDEEIRTVAQLVRSVADFPAVSYVLAYDVDRVIQALGSGAAPDQREERGRAYLEKIVQLQLPLPITFADEITRLINAEIFALRSELVLPEAFEHIARYKELLQIFIDEVIETPRDIRRLVGAFHVLAGMLRDEVDWIDLLAFSALLIKAPGTAAKIRRDPDDVVENPISARAMVRRFERDKILLEDRLNEIIPTSERNNGTKALLGFLFPSLADDKEQVNDHPDALCLRRPLLTTLRLGLLPGAVSRAEVQTLVTSSPDEVQTQLRRAYENGTLEHLVDRLDDLYAELDSFDHVAFWQGVAKFVRKPNCAWQTSYQPMYEAVRNLASVLERAVRRREQLRQEASAVFTTLHDMGEAELTAYWLRRHLFVYGLFGREKRGGNAWFFSAEQTEALARKLAIAWRDAHLSDELFPCIWGLQPVFIMMDVGVWDALCRDQLARTLEDDLAFDSFSLMLFGAHFSTDRTTLEKMCDYEAYIARAQQRLEAGGNSLHETVREAHKKAIGDG